MALQVGAVSGVTVIYGYDACTTLTSKWLHSKVDTHPVIREGALHEQGRKLLYLKEIKIWSSVPKGARQQNEIADWQYVATYLRPRPVPVTHCPEAELSRHITGGIYF
jgi:hypothetical protein